MQAPPKNGHPATFSKQLWPILIKEMRGHQRVLDPFAGVGTIHELAEAAGVPISVGYEIEGEWANVEQYPSIPRKQVVGDFLTSKDRTAYDIVVTSPCYGNRMADHHTANDASKRNTYKHRLGRELSDGSSASMQWGDAYREFHIKAWSKCYRTLSLYPYPTSRDFILNIKDHIRKGERQYVTDWHVDTLEAIGFIFIDEYKIPCPGNRHGENGKLRIEHESIITFEMEP